MNNARNVITERICISVVCRGPLKPSRLFNEAGADFAKSVNAQA